MRLCVSKYTLILSYVNGLCIFRNGRSGVMFISFTISQFTWKTYMPDVGQMNCPVVALYPFPTLTKTRSYTTVSACRICWSWVRPAEKATALGSLWPCWPRTGKGGDRWCLEWTSLTNEELTMVSKGKVITLKLGIRVSVNVIVIYLSSNASRRIHCIV